MNFSQQFLLNGAMALLGYYSTYKMIPKLRSMFVDAHLYGIDLCKKAQAKKIPESQGVISGCIYLVMLFCFIPIQFSQFKASMDREIFFDQKLNLYDHYLFIQFLAGLLSICCMLFLGFADDVLNLRWRIKLFLPTLASLPLLIVYSLTYDNTTIIVPKPFRSILGFSIDLNILYYVYLSMLAVFCTNAINILAGINGIETGQSILICLSIILYNIAEIIRATDHWYSHQFSLNMMIPFLGVTLGLHKHNWFPAKVFVGDTFCYFAGMTFAVVGILGHFSKTMLLFFLPQIINFLYSCPQLFHLLPCPRHRLPKYHPETDRLNPSNFQFNRDETNQIGLLILKFFH
ncbi:putative N-acetyltransferase san [Sarcoptes scabiei]|nr:putative N-acetyltransferase san [Sarcoptes scabiei]